MRHSLAFLLGLFDRSPAACVSWEDFQSEHGPALRLWQQLGLLANEPAWNAAASCPHCWGGTPLPLAGRYVCDSCLSAVDDRHLLLWRFDLDALLVWLVRALSIEGGVRPVEEPLWQLGSFAWEESVYECFLVRGGPVSERGRTRLLAYRHAVLLRPLPGEAGVEGFQGPCVSLLELLRQDADSLTATDLSGLLRKGGTVRFDAESGVLWAGDMWLGEVPVGSKEYHLLACLARQLDRYVPYADLKHAVLRATGSTDTTEEATFCQKLKGRIKKTVPKIDAVIATTNKADGYRLRGHVALSERW
jgi:hypothetical protein